MGEKSFPQIRKGVLHHTIIKPCIKYETCHMVLFMEKWRSRNNEIYFN